MREFENQLQRLYRNYKKSDEAGIDLEQAYPAAVRNQKSIVIAELKEELLSYCSYPVFGDNAVLNDKLSVMTTECLERARKRILHLLINKSGNESHWYHYQDMTLIRQELIRADMELNSVYGDYCVANYLNGIIYSGFNTRNLSEFAKSFCGKEKRTAIAVFAASVCCVRSNGRTAQEMALHNTTQEDIYASAKHIRSELWAVQNPDDVLTLMKRISEELSP